MDTSRLTSGELLIILDITRRLAELRLVNPLMAYVATTLFEITAAERCMIVLFGEDGSPQIQIAQDRHGRTIGAASDQMSGSILQRVRDTLSPLRVGDALSDTALQGAHSVRSLGLRSVMCVPLISFGQAIGAIYVENRSARNQFREENLVPLMLLSYQVATAIENARQNEQLEARIAERTRELESANAQLAAQAAILYDQSIRDGLTGLYNRRYFDLNLSQICTLAQRYTQPLSLALLDLDNFKKINDRFLHATGDQVLRSVANLLVENVRKVDTVARIGGEEFAILMPQTAQAAALNICERIRTIIEKHGWQQIVTGLQVTISIGVVENIGGADAPTLLALADEGLYAAKRQGRNCTVAAPASPAA